MTTTYGTINNAYVTLAMMGQTKLPTATAYKLFKLRKTLKDPFDFRGEKQIQIAEAHAGTVDDNGNIHFEDAEEKKAYMDELAALDKEEVDVTGVVKISIQTSEIQSITINEIAALDDFVDFK